MSGHLVCRRAFPQWDGNHEWVHIEFVDDGPLPFEFAYDPQHFLYHRRCDAATAKPILEHVFANASALYHDASTPSHSRHAEARVYQRSRWRDVLAERGSRSERLTMRDHSMKAIPTVSWLPGLSRMSPMRDVVCLIDAPNDASRALFRTVQRALITDMLTDDWLCDMWIAGLFSAPTEAHVMLRHLAEAISLSEGDRLLAEALRQRSGLALHTATGWLLEHS